MLFYHLIPECVKHRALAPCLPGLYSGNVFHDQAVIAIFNNDYGTITTATTSTAATPACTPNSPTAHTLP